MKRSYWWTIAVAVAVVAVALAVVIGVQQFRHDHEAVAVHGEDGQVQYYTCGMHPWVVLPKPGDCPICHMELTPLDPAKFKGEIAINPAVVQNIGVRIAPVESGPLTKTINTVGTIDYNESAVRDVNLKTPGWIEELHVDFVGARVEEGQPLLELYSPQLYAAQEEYLLALQGRGNVAAGVSAQANQGATDLVEAARTRLEYFDITPEQIEEIEHSGEAQKTMTIRSPHSGVVIAKHANEGMKVDPGMQAYRIADLSKVWVLVTLYEQQLPYVHEGMKATMTLPYVPNQPFEGEVIYVYPYLDRQTREVQVRLEFDNPNNLLKPGMFANVELTSTLAAEKTLVPRSAVIDTGQRQMAFVSLGEGKFEPRPVKLGTETGDGMVEVVSGLKPGEMVVTSGQFLLDSEAKMREALARMIEGEMAANQQPTAAPAEEGAVEELPEPVVAALNRVLSAYLAVGELLAADEVQGIDQHAREVAAALDAMVQTEISDDPHFWHEHEDAVAAARASAQKLQGVADIEQARLIYADLSIALQQIVTATGVPAEFDQEVQVLHCPMYREGQGGTTWLQTAGDVRNPYYGASMLRCYDERKALPVTGGGEDESAATEEVIEEQPAPAAADEAQPAVAAAEYPINFCLVSGQPLGSMGAPVEVTYEGRTLKFCCESCIGEFQANADEYVKKLDEAAATLGNTHDAHQGPQGDE